MVVGTESGENPAAEGYNRSSSLGGCGNALTDQYRKAMRSIIGTMMKQTTNSTILNLSQHLGTTITTSDCGRITMSLPESSSDDVRSA